MNSFRLISESGSHAADAMRSECENLFSEWNKGLAYTFLTSDFWLLNSEIGVLV